MNEDYRKGYRDGFEDGHKAGAASGRNLNLSQPISIPTVIPDWNKAAHPNDYMTTNVVCSECGMEWKGAMGYVCYNPKCLIQPKVTSYTK